MKTVLLGIILAGLGMLVLHKAGVEDGARQMARHILNPKFETKRFYKIMSDECGQSDGVLSVNGCTIIFKDGITIDGRDFPKNKWCKDYAPECN